MTPYPRLRMTLVIIGWVFAIAAVYCVYSNRAAWEGITAITVGVGLATAAWVLGLRSDWNHYVKEEHEHG